MRCVLLYCTFDDVFSSDRFNVECYHASFQFSYGMSPGNEVTFVAVPPRNGIRHRSPW